MNATNMPYTNEHTCRKDEGVATGMLLGVDTVDMWEEGGHLWRIDEIAPRLVGASMRHYELLMDGEPAGGGRYHMTIEHARERAKYCAEGSMHMQIKYLWELVQKYRQRLSKYEGTWAE